MKISNFKLKIGIDASRAFIKNRTGIEEYSYQVIKNLRQQLKSQQVILYLRPGDKKNINFKIPRNWQVKELIWGYFWTQFGLSLELLLNPIDSLFVPAHTLPFIHPRKSFVTIHGLEYEFSPESYSIYSRIFHRFFIKRSCHWAKRIISVSAKTKNDLIKLYNVSEQNIKIIPNGFDKKDFSQSMVSNKLENVKEKLNLPKNFLFFIGRLEERKNIVGIIKAFEILKKKYNYPGELLLAGGQGHGYDKIEVTIKKSKYRDNIKELGFVSNSEKWLYLKEADIFVFPSLLEGFGIPILEAQIAGTPVVTSDIDPMKEVAGDKRILANPEKPNAIAKVSNAILQNPVMRDDIIKNGLENVKKFSWEKTAEKISKILIK